MSWQGRKSMQKKFVIQFLAVALKLTIGYKNIQIQTILIVLVTVHIHHRLQVHHLVDELVQHHFVLRRWRFCVL